MTAFGSRTVAATLDDPAGGELVWEVRAVNHRYLELGVRLPEQLGSLEADVRRRAGLCLHRGKVDLRLQWRREEVLTGDLAIQQPLLQALSVAVGDVQRHLPGATVDALSVLSWPGVIRSALPAVPDEAVVHAALTALDEVLADLVAQRAREGQQIATLLGTRAAGIRARVAELRRLRPGVLAALRERQLARLAVLDVAHDSARLEQELVHAAQRLDVDEELDRLDAHVDELHHALQRAEPVGRRLDFLMQEFNREANTLGAKAADSVMTQASIDMKVLIEQMREQVQNVE